jgi:hypothetical protein
MTLSFPNPSRSFDAAQNRVQFWGYDRAIEVTFFMETDALEKLCPDINSVEAGFLEAFDRARKRIHEAAEKVYTRGRKGLYAYLLTSKHF